VRHLGAVVLEREAARGIERAAGAVAQIGALGRKIERP
jgi:hypothetical protein